MKALLWNDNGLIENKNVAKPKADEGEVLIKINSVGICGTDLTIFNGYFPKDRLKPPLILGHEFSGQIEKLGNNVTNYNIGEYVVVNPLISCNKCYSCEAGDKHVCSSLKVLGVDCDGALAEFISVPQEMVHKLPDNVSCDEGALVEPMAVAVHAIRQSDLKIGDSVHVIGGGPIGVFIALLSEFAGAGKVILSEIQDYRVNFIRSNGFKVFNPIKDDLKDLLEFNFGCIGADIVFEVTGTEKGFQLALDSGRVKGTIVEVGVPKKAMNLNLNRLNFAELKIVGSRVYAPIDFKVALKQLGVQINNKPGLFEGIVKKYAFDECEKVLRELNSKDSTVMKAIVNI